MNWTVEINNEFRQILKKGRKTGKARLSDEQIDNAELTFLPYYNLQNKKSVVICPPVSVISNITEDLYQDIKKIYPRYWEEITAHFEVSQ